MNFEKFEDILGSLDSILSAENGTDKKSVAPLLGELYDTVVGKYRPAIQAAPMLAGKIAADAVPIIEAVLKGVNDVVENPEIEAELQRSREIRAAARRENYKAYTEAGFSRAEAMALVLVDAAMPKGRGRTFPRTSEPRLVLQERLGRTHKMCNPRTSCAGGFAI